VLPLTRINAKRLRTVPPLLSQSKGGRQQKGPGVDQPSPNNRALTTGGDDPKGGAIVRITFAGLLGCSVEMSCEKSATVQTK
jgi:hypothetical protein